jgi:hypothetical protein
MATRMQQRRGTAAQWTAANPILSAGEIGFETDTGQFKIGDGTTAWQDISYFKNLEDLGGSLDDYILVTEKGAANGVATLDANASIPVAQLTNIIDSAPGTLDTLKELADSITDAGGLVQTSIASAIDVEMAARDLAIQTAKTEAIDAAAAQAQTFTEGAITTADQAIRSDLGVDISDAQAAAESFATAADSTLHTTITGEISTAATAAENNAKAHADTEVSTHALDTTNVHGIADTSVLATATDVSDAVSAHNADTTGVHGIADTAELETQTGAQAKADNAVTAAEASAAALYATKVAPAITGNASAENLTITGNLTVQGTTTTVAATNLEVTDSLIYLAAEQYDVDTVDIGIFGAYGDAQAGHFHTGIVRDATDGKWKLISGADEPTDSHVDFSTGTYDTLKLGAVEFADGTQTKQGVPSITTIINKTASYTLSDLAERDNLIEIASSSATTLTIPADSAVNYPIGTSLDILQTSSGQVTIAGAAGVTVNATPGLKLRTQWSSATLTKRAANTWVVYGDLTV